MPTGHTFPRLESDHAAFLRERAKPILTRQPRLAELRRRLLDLGGLEVVWQQTEIHLDDLIERGRTYTRSRMRRRFIADSECHPNAASLWYESRGATKIATGYALGDSGLWFSHSWGVEDGRIIETTSSRGLGYFGVELSGEIALRFMLGNASRELMKRFKADVRSGSCFRELVDIATAVAAPLASRNSGGVG